MYEGSAPPSSTMSRKKCGSCSGSAVASGLVPGSSKVPAPMAPSRITSRLEKLRMCADHLCSKKLGFMVMANVMAAIVSAAGCLAYSRRKKSRQAVYSSSLAL